jgi:Tfp pilus assembly protein PilV
MTHPPRSVGRRAGLTLLEVVVSLTILLFSIVAISQLVNIGSDRAMDVQQQARASMLCQSKLDEIMIGAETLSTTGYTPFSDAGTDGWQWKLDANQNDVSNLWNVIVSVKYDGDDGRTFETQIARMMLDPSVRGSTQDTPPNTGTDGTGGTNSSNANSNNSSSANNNTPAANTPAAGSKAGSTSGKGATPGGGDKTPVGGKGKTGAGAPGGGKTGTGGTGTGSTGGGKTGAGSGTPPAGGGKTGASTPSVSPTTGSGNNTPPATGGKGGKGG